MSAETSLSQWQQEFLDGLREQQAAYLATIEEWRTSVAAPKTGGAAPAPGAPGIPTMTGAMFPSGFDGAGANAAFIEAVSNLQKDFFERLTVALSPTSPS